MLKLERHLVIAQCCLRHSQGLMLKSAHRGCSRKPQTKRVTACILSRFDIIVESPTISISSAFTLCFSSNQFSATGFGLFLWERVATQHINKVLTHTMLRQNVWYKFRWLVGNKCHSETRFIQLSERFY